MRYPPPNEAPVFPDVPEAIAKVAKEAWQGYDAEMYRSALTNARAVIEATAKAKGITKGDLADKIDSMVSENLLPQRLKIAIHEVRHAGNDVAHGDLGRFVDPYEAKTLLTVMNQVLDEIYTSPAQIQRLVDARKDRERETKMASQQARQEAQEEPPF